MSKTTVFAGDILKLILNATPLANFADNAVSSPATNIYVSLHTADPGEGGDQTTNELTTGAMTNYARVAVARTTGGWTVTNDVVAPAATINFAQSSGGTGATVTHVGLGRDASAAGKLLWKGALSPNIVVATNVTPRITTSSTITEA